MNSRRPAGHVRAGGRRQRAGREGRPRPPLRPPASGPGWLGVGVLGGVFVMAMGAASQDAREFAWTRVAETTAFSPRDTAEEVVFQGRMWLSNGYGPGGVLVRDLWNSRDGAHWERVSEDTPYDGYSEMVVYQNRLWAVKGSVWNSADGVDWRQVAAETPFGTRRYGELVVFRDGMWQLGSGADVWHTADGIDWQCAHRQAPYGDRFGSAVAVYRDRLWLIGGAVQQASTPPEKHYAQYTTRNDVWCSEDGARWTRVLDHAPWAERMWTVARVYADRLWIIGGFSNRDSLNFADAWFTEDGVTWQACASEPMFSPRHEVSSYVFEGSLWVVAGNSWPLMNDVWKLTWPVGESASPAPDGQR